MSDDGGQAMSGFVCRGCKNYFLQDRLCTTCGAGKLYDATVESQAAEIERLRAEIAKLEGEANA